jgi:hypothetical protein
MNNFQVRYQQARLFAAQVRARQAMGDRYDHAKPSAVPKIPKRKFNA